MYKAISILIFFAVGIPALAESMLCELTDRPQSSELRIDFENNLASAVYLRSPNEKNYRKLNVSITTISKKEDSAEGYESIFVKPIPPADIDWEKIEECFIEVGTAWHFEFVHERPEYQVHFVPFFATETPSCVTPRVPPQTHRLNCKLSQY